MNDLYNFLSSYAFTFIVFYLNVIGYLLDVSFFMYFYGNFAAETVD